MFPDGHLESEGFRQHKAAVGGWIPRMLLDHGIEISMDGRDRCHDNIFVERLWWTMKHEWVYLRPANNGIEQKRSPR